MSKFQNENRHMAGVLLEIQSERERQDERWGGSEHDDEHSTVEFIEFIKGYADLAREESIFGKEKRRRLIQVAALAVAAIESMDRKLLTIAKEGNEK